MESFRGNFLIFPTLKKPVNKIWMLLSDELGPESARNMDITYRIGSSQKLVSGELSNQNTTQSHNEILLLATP